MSEQVKVALIIAVGIVVATFVYTWTTAYYSPYSRYTRCLAAVSELNENGAYGTAGEQQLRCRLHVLH